MLILSQGVFSAKKLQLKQWSLKSASVLILSLGSFFCEKTPAKAM